MTSFSMENLCVAYRKAKVDLYYSSHASLRKMADYEAELSKNLEALLSKINGKSEDWILEPDFLGAWILVPKSISWVARDDLRRDFGNGLIYSSPAEEWQHWEERIEKSGDEDHQTSPTAEFRLMARCSLDLHVLSTLWMLKIGDRLDKKLTGCAYGNRLRRTQEGQINELSLGTFAPYLKPFREWRERGIAAMSAGLDANKRIIALTADVSSFYHELNPHFLLNDDFIENVLNIEMSEDELKLHRLFINSIIAWAKNTPLNKGLPVGLPASAIIANIALVELDRFVEREIAPLYYGRYVDDILLVMENGSKWSNTKDIWEWVFARSSGILGWVDPDRTTRISFRPSYFSVGDGRSDIYFANAKNKIFILTGETGKNLVKSLRHEINQRASEWRAMPRLPQSADFVGTDLLAATESNGERADNLRKTDALTMRRASFAIKLRDFEAYERDLQPDAWASHRNAFFNAFVQHVVQLPYFFELANYLPRVIKLAVACEDFDSLRKIFFAVGCLYKKVQKSCKLIIKGVSIGIYKDDFSIISKWRNQLVESMLESVVSAFPAKLSKIGAIKWEKHFSFILNENILSENGFNGWPLNIDDLRKEQHYLFLHDLAHQPFRFSVFPKEMVAQRGIPEIGSLSFVVPAGISGILLDGVKVISGWVGCSVSNIPGILFPTRPFNLAELCIFGKPGCDGEFANQLRKVVLAQRGFSVINGVPSLDGDIIKIPVVDSNPRVVMAVSSWKTDMASWIASVVGASDPDITRYERLNRMINDVISNPIGANYLVLPELAMPAHWFMRVAKKLHSRRISLITGIQYLHFRGAVRNQVWASLCHNGLGFPSFYVYRQDKQLPALHEEQELHRIGGLQLVPENRWETPPIIQHGNFRFSILICSELTNIAYRAALRGKVDALFVPEWNQDIDVFNALVESASLDIHAYIVQCNDRQYGDSRIRAPYKDGWMRDILRIKGGVTDYCVIGEVDIKSLRRFQSNHRSPSSPFKPVPDGFYISDGRKTLPL